MGTAIRAARDIVQYLLQHPLAGRQPLRSLGRVFAWQARSRLANGPVLHRWVNDSKLVVRRGMPGATGNVYLGLHEFADMAFVLHFLRRGDRFADIGANVGSYTVLAAAVVGAHVHSFEPDPGTADNLRANIRANDVVDTVTVHQHALGGEQGEIGFTVGLDTINRVAAAGEEQRRVRIERLDDVIRDDVPRLMKVDVEGYEDAVFSGALRMLSEPALQAIIIETVSAETEQRFLEAGFVEKHYDPFTRSLNDRANRWRDHNRLFIRKSALDEVRNRLNQAAKFTVHAQSI